MLTGTIPDSVCDLSKLGTLYVSLFDSWVSYFRCLTFWNRYLNVNQLEGTIPQNIGKASMLTSLYVIVPVSPHACYFTTFFVVILTDSINLLNFAFVDC